MNNPAEEQSHSITLDEKPAKKGRGRPATGKAMSPAEKQRAYRERCQTEQARMIQELESKLAEAIARAEKAEKANKGSVIQKANAVFVLQTKEGNSWKDSEICYFSTMQKAKNALKSLGEEGQNKEMWRIRQRQFL